MPVRSLYRVYAAAFLAAMLSLRQTQGQQPLPPVDATPLPASTNSSAPTNSPAPTNYDIQAILARLEQQAAELQQLRAQLNQQALNPTAPNQPPTPNQPLGSNINAPANSLANFSSAAYLLNGSASEIATEFDQRLTALEQQVAQPAALGAAKPGEPVEVGSDKKLNATWNNGLEFKNSAGDFRLHIGGASNFDINSFNTDPWLEAPPADGGLGPNPDSLQLRRARLTADGTFYEVIDFKMEYEFANFLDSAAPSVGQPVVSSPAFTDFWLQWSKLPVVGNIRAGNQKEPLGMEHMMSFRFTDFSERSYLQDVVFGPFNNGFNPGISLFNWLDDERFTWAIGAFGNNTDPFGYSLGGDWAVTGRSTYLLFYDEPSQGRYLWEVGVAGSVRKPDEDLVRLRARGNIRSGPPGVLNPEYADTGNIEAAQQEILALETAMQFGPWTLQWEYVGTWLEDAIQPFSPPDARVSRGSPFFQGGYIQLFYFLTGEHRTYNKRIAALDRVIPHENFFWVNSKGGHCWGWGAWQIGAKYSALDLNDNGINGGMLHSGTFGVNWFLNPNAKMQFNYDITHRGRVSETVPGNISAFGVRFAYDF